MAPPFSGIETAFRVNINSKTYYANCAWDALGIPAALHADGTVEAADGQTGEAADGQTGEAMTLTIREGKPLPEPCAIHFAVPAARWWEDIIHT